MFPLPVMDPREGKGEGEQIWSCLNTDQAPECRWMDVMPESPPAARDEGGISDKKARTRARKGASGCGRASKDEGDFSSFPPQKMGRSQRKRGS
jgi:hypothetical protein